MQKIILTALLFIFFHSLIQAEDAKNPAKVIGTVTIPSRIGITRNGHAREKSGSVTIIPAAEAVRVTVSTTSAKITLSNIVTNTTTGIITFAITGVTASGKPDDVPIVAQHSTRGELDKKTFR